MDPASFVTKRFARAAACGAALLVGAALPASAQGPGGPNGVDIKIRAENRVTTDLPWCLVGGGEVGDRLAVDAFMDADGNVTGTARFTPASGVETLIEIDRMFAFSICNPSNCGGILVQNQADQNTVPIWINDFLFGAGTTFALVNVELPRGCGNTKSTFTPGLDKVTTQINFR